ncbi:MAG: arginine deiminase [Bacteroidales bacterium]|nr:arginine deiminase [Bacteroidales bacterium]
MNKVQVNSEIGRLNAVLLHRPGIEIERMTPENAAKALYSDILNKSIVDKEYNRFATVLSKWTKAYFVVDLLEEILKDETVKNNLVEQSCKLDGCEFLKEELLLHTPSQLAKELIEGFAYRQAVDPDKYQEDRYILKPLYNLFFTRDASSTVFNRVLIHNMSTDVREREILIYNAIFTNYFGCETLSTRGYAMDARTEGGDVLIAREDTLFIGNGGRTNTKGIQYLAETFAKERSKFNILVQELPQSPESFIHLDMVFTFLGTHQCMAYEPLIMKNSYYSQYKTTYIAIDNGKITYHEKPNFIIGARDLGFDLNPVFCGGADYWNQQREQWHSGANFFALGEGKVIGYQRNTNTIEAMDKAGFAVLDADDICQGKVDMNDYEKFVATFAASELPRGGGGARCMTMPINRNEVDWNK